MREDVQDEYVRQVSEALKRTGHPRRTEILTELRNHLESELAETGDLQTLDQFIERFGSPQEYVDNLTLYPVARKKPWHRRRSTYAFAAIIMLLAVAALSLPDRHTLAAHLWTSLDQNYVAGSPFFSLDRARSLKVGATADEVRDAIGIPWRRYPGIGRHNEQEQWRHLRTDTFSYAAEEKEVVWEFTMLKSHEFPFYTVCNVIFDEENHLLRVDIFRFNVPLDARHTLAQASRSRRVGDARLLKSDGTAFKIASSDPNLWIKIGFAPQPQNVREQIEHLQARVIESWADIPMDKVRFLFVAERDGDLSAETFSEIMRDTPESLPVFDSSETNLYTNKAFPYDPNEPFAVMLYKSGTIYEYPFGDPAPNLLAEWRQDQNWLVRKLL